MLELLIEFFLVQHLLENHNPVLTCGVPPKPIQTTQKKWNCYPLKRLCGTMPATRKGSVLCLPSGHQLDRQSSQLSVTIASPGITLSNFQSQHSLLCNGTKCCFSLGAVHGHYGFYLLVNTGSVLIPFFVVTGLANHNLSSISSLPVSDWPRIWTCDTRVILTGIDDLQMPISFHLSC